MKTWTSIQVFFLVLSGFIATLTEQNVSSSDLAPILSTLQNISAAVFTLSGIWIAYMYPEAIAAFTNTKKISLLTGSEHVNKIRELVLIIFTSAFVLIGVLLYNLVYSLFSSSILVTSNIEIFRWLAICFILFISLNQIKAISSIMLNNIKFIDRLYHLKTEREVENDL